MLRHFTKLVVASLFASLCQLAVAQPDPFRGNGTGTISGTGMVLLRPKATILRMHLRLAKNGDDMEAILKALDQTGEAFRKSLLKANASKDSIKIDGPRLRGPLHAVGELLSYDEPRPVQRAKGKGKSAQQIQQMPANMNAPQQQQSAQPPGPQSPRHTEREAKRAPRIMVEIQLRAEWSLHGNTTSELLIEADHIILNAHEQIKDLLPKKAMPSRYGDSKGKSEEPFDSGEEDIEESSEVIEPEYVFVGTIPAEQLETARIEAFKQATVEVEALVKIAKLGVGTIQDFSVSDRGFREGSADDPFSEPSSGYAAPVPPMPPPGGMLNPGGVVPFRGFFGPREIVGYDPSGLEHSVSVSATYHLKPR
jgi:hypothetical protein